MRTLFIASSLFALSTAACGEARYDLVIITGSADVMRDAFIYDVFVLEDGCTGAKADGTDPEINGVMTHLTWTRNADGPEIGALEPGTYGFYARVRNDRCDIEWAACVRAEVEEDGDGRIEIPLDPVNGPTCIDTIACNGTERCDAAMGCIRAAPVNCADAFPCTLDLCAEPSGDCIHAPIHVMCPEEHLCNDEGGCRPPTTVCINAEQCQDGDTCNGEERCLEERCARPLRPGCTGDFACPTPACDPLRDACIDADEDGAHCGIDCDDHNNARSPENVEICNDIDDDCDGLNNEGEVCQ